MTRGAVARSRGAKRRANRVGPLRRVWMAITVAAMVILAAIAAFSVIALLNSATQNLDRYLVAVLERQLRRPVRLADLDVLRPGRIRATGLEVAAGPTFADGVMLRAPEIVAQYRLWDLIRGRVDPVGSISEVLIRRPFLLIVRDKNNRFNLQELFPKTDRAPRPSPFRGIVRVEGGTLRFDDQAVADLPAPQSNTLYNVNGTLDAGAPPLMVFGVSARGDGRRVGPVAVEGDYQPDRGAFSLRVNTDTRAGAYWTRYFIESGDVTVDAARASVSVDVWKPRQTEPLNATIRVDVRDGAARTRYTRAPLTDLRGIFTLRTGLALETTVDVQAQTAGIPVRVYGNVFTGRDARLALRVSASNVTMASVSRAFPQTPNLEWLTPLAPASVEAQVYGPLQDITAVANVQLPSAKLYTTVVSNISARVRYHDDVVYIPSLSGMAAGTVVNGEGSVNLRTNAIRLVANVPGVEANRLGLEQLPLTGAITSRVVVTGSTSAPKTSVLVSVANGAFDQVPFERLTARIVVEGDTVHVRDAVGTLPGGTLFARGNIRLNGPMDLRVSASGLRMGRLLAALGYPDITGTAFFQGNVRGTTEQPVVQGETQIYDINLRGQRLDYVVGSFDATPRRVRLSNVTLARYPAQAALSGTATFLPNGQVGLDMLARLQSGRLEPFLRDAGLEVFAEGDIVTETPVRIAGTLANPDVTGKILLSESTVEGYPIRMAEADFHFHNNELALSDIVAESELGSAADTTRLSLPALLIGEDRLVAPEPFRITNIHLDAIPGLGAPYASLAGDVSITGHISGTRSDPRVTAEIRAEDVRVNTQAFPLATASLAYQDNRVSVSDLSVRRPAGEVLSVPNAVWDQQAKTLNAEIRSEALPLQMARDLLVQSDWYNYRADPRVRDTVRELDRMDVQLKNATLAFAESVADGGTRGALNLAYNTQGLSVNGAIVLRDVRMQDQNLDVLSVTGSVTNLHSEEGRLLASIDIPANGLRAESGDMTVSGQLDGAVGGGIDGQVEALNIPVAIARLFVKRPSAESGSAAFDPANLSGDLTVVVDATGMWDHPEVVASISGQDLRVPGSDLPLSLRTSAIRINNHPAGSRIEIERNISILARDHSVKITGSAPFDWTTKRIPPDRPLNLVAHVDEQGLDMLGLLLGGTETGPIETATGTLVADLSLTGTLNDPKLAGYLDVENGAIKLRALRSTFRNINADLRLSDAGDTIEIEQFEMESSDGGKLRALEDGRIGLPRSFGSLAGLKPDIAVDLDGFRIVEVPNALGLGERFQATLETPDDEPLRVVQTGGNPTLQGRIVLSDVEVTPPNQTPAAKGGGRAPAIVPAFDLTLVVGKNVWVRNPLFRVLLNDRGGVKERSLNFSGTLLQPRINGSLTSREGTLVYPTARFRLTDATVRVHYPALEGLPGVVGESFADEAPFTIEADAQTRLIATVNGQRQPINVYIHIEGPNPSLTPGSDESAFGSLSPYRINLRSSPSLPERQLVALITREDALQRLAEGGNPEEVLRQETMNILQASVLPEALSGFESRLGDAFGLETLTLDYTMVNSTLSVTAVKRLTDRIALTYSRPIGETTAENAYTISLHYQIRPRLQLTLQQQRGAFLAGQRQTAVPGSTSSITESLILLEGTYPF